MAKEYVGGAVQLARHATTLDEKAHQYEHRQHRQLVFLAGIDDKSRRVGNRGSLAGKKGEANTADNPERKAEWHPQKGEEKKGSKAYKRDDHCLFPRNPITCLVGKHPPGP